MTTPNNGAAPAAPMTEEDRFAAAFEEFDAADAAQAEADKPAPREPQPETQPSEPTQGRARDPQTGQFVPGSGRQPEPAAEPFEGYKDLPPKAREYFDRLQSDSRAAINRAANAQRDLARLQRQQQAPRTQAQAQPRGAPAPAPAPQPRTLPKWDQAKAEHPDFFASLEERILAAENDAGRALTDIEKRLARAEQQVQETAEIANRFREREAEEHRNETKGTLDTIAPNWKRIAGWEDANGNAVPPDQQSYAPEFQAWLNVQPESVKQRRLEDLDSDDPHIIGKVFQDFERDYAEAMGWHTRQPGSGSPATPTNPVAQRRQAAVSDRLPRANAGPPRGGNEERRPPNRRDAEEDAFDAITDDDLQKWRGLR